MDLSMAKEYNVVVRITDETAFKKITDDLYDGNLEEAVKGELAWLQASGLEAEVQQGFLSTTNDQAGDELELTTEMVQRNDEIDNAVFSCITTLTEQKLEWNMEIIGRVTDAIKDILAEYGLKVRHPAIEIDEGGNQRYVEYD